MNLVLAVRLLSRHLLAMAVVATALSGCSFWGDDEEACVSEEEYQEARVAPDLSIPAGLDRPDPSGRLNIPEEPQPVAPLSKNAACLQRPPNYLDKAKTTPPAAN